MVVLNDITFCYETENVCTVLLLAKFFDENFCGKRTFRLDLWIRICGRLSLVSAPSETHSTQWIIHRISFF